MNTVTYYKIQSRPSEMFRKLSLTVLNDNPGIKDQDVILKVTEILMTSGRDPQYIQDAFNVLCGTQKDDLVKYPNEFIETKGEEIGYYIRTKYIGSLLSGSQTTEDETIQFIFDSKLLFNADKEPLSVAELNALYQERCKKNIKPITF